jgi:hypothetical protein
MTGLVVCSLFQGCQSYGFVTTFDPAAFAEIYPQWSTLTPEQLQASFDIATLYFRNDGSSPARTQATQNNLLNLLTAHILQLTYGSDPSSGPPGIVGRINSASEGSVSVGADYPATANSAWFLQTPFGAMFWQATAAYRMTRYLPGRTRFGTGIAGNNFPGGRRW